MLHEDDMPTLTEWAEYLHRMETEAMWEPFWPHVVKDGERVIASLGGHIVELDETWNSSLVFDPKGWKWNG